MRLGTNPPRDPMRVGYVFPQMEIPEHSRNHWTKSNRRAAEKKVAKRRAKKGYR